jgi:hypothetical protein
MSERRCIVSSTQQRNAQWDIAEQAVAEALRACLPQHQFQVFHFGRKYRPYPGCTHTQASLTEADLRTLDCAVSVLGWRGWGYAPTGIAFKPTTVRLDPTLAN